MKEKIAKFILLGFVILFAGLLFADANGYYVSKTYEHKTLTEEQIKKFEEDIKMGSRSMLRIILLIMKRIILISFLMVFTRFL